MCVIFGFRAERAIEAVNFIEKNLKLLASDLESKGRDGCSITFLQYGRAYITKRIDKGLIDTWKDWKKEHLGEITLDCPTYIVLFSRQKPEMESDTSSEDILPPFELKTEWGYIWLHGTISNEEELLKKIKEDSDRPQPEGEIKVDTEILSYLTIEEIVKDVKGWATIIAYTNDGFSVGFDFLREDLGIFAYQDGERDYFCTLPAMTTFRTVGTPLVERDKIISSKSRRLTEDSEKRIDNLYVAYSGGMDATFSTYYYLYKRQYLQPKKVNLVYFDYGQLAKEQEIKALERFADLLKKDFPKLEVETKIIDASQIIGSFASLSKTTDLRLVSGKKDDLEKEAESNLSYIPFRNTIFALVLKQLAENDSAKRPHILFGLNLTEGMTFGDNSEPWAGFLSIALRYAGKFYQECEIIAPFAHLTKTKYLELCLRELGKDKVKELLDISYSCYYPQEDGSPCGKCGSCTLRNEALRKLEI